MIMSIIKNLVLIACCAIALTTQAQIDIQGAIERKARERAERKVDQTIDKGFDKTEEGLDEGTREATKKKGNKGAEVNTTEGSGTSEEGSSTASKETPKTPLRSYSKFDFVPGDKVIYMEDFADDAIGDYPAGWNTESSGEIVTVEAAPGRWYKFTGHGYAYPEGIETLPENFTVEFNVTGLEENASCSSLGILFRNNEGNLFSISYSGLVRMGIMPRGAGTEGAPYADIYTHNTDGETVINNSKWLDQPATEARPPISRVSINRQKNRLRMYLNETKVWDLPRAFTDGIAYRLVFEEGGCTDNPIHISDLRIAEGAPDTRNKLVTEGKFTTRGIQFDSGSDRLRPESYGVLKEIAGALTDNAGMRVKIIGHTDSDGENAANLELSKRRAQAVKKALSEEFNIAGDRMDTDGKGEEDPAGPNDSAEGKANNRRVEFLKL